MELVPVRMKMPQVLKAEWIWEIVARDSGEEKESQAKRGVQSMTGTWLIFSDGLCFVGMEEGLKPGSLSYVLCLTAVECIVRVGSRLITDTIWKFLSRHADYSAYEAVSRMT